MYSGTTIHTKSGRIMGVHQKVDRIARRHLARRGMLPSNFPNIREILHFEGANGPDGLKRKRPGIDEPWHFIEPNQSITGSELGAMIHDHISNLAVALGSSDQERAAFEAAWLAHAITDGLTPAHHYPLQDKLSQLHGASGRVERNTTRKKLIIPGKTRRQAVRNNWEYWGAKGVMTTHLHFEWGVAAAIATMRFDTFSFFPNLTKVTSRKSFDDQFDKSLREISSMEMYEEFATKGWTRHLASETKNILVPEIVRIVMLGWLVAINESDTAI